MYSDHKKTYIVEVFEDRDSQDTKEFEIKGKSNAKRFIEDIIKDGGSVFKISTLGGEVLFDAQIEDGATLTQLGFSMLKCPTDRKQEFVEMMERTKLCVDKTNPQTLQEFNDCEAIDPHHQSRLIPYTFHTHPEGTEPSEIDKQTTAKYGKKLLCIGHVPSNKVYCWDGSNFDNLKCKF